VIGVIKAAGTFIYVAGKDALEGFVLFEGLMKRPETAKEIGVPYHATSREEKGRTKSLSTDSGGGARLSKRSPSPRLNALYQPLFFPV
jgi:hypothetical protein